MDNKTTTTDFNVMMGKIEAQIKNINEVHKEFKSSLESLSERLTVVERHNSFIKGGVAAFLVMGGMIGAMIDHVVKCVVGR